MQCSGVSVLLWLWGNDLGSTASLRAHSEDFPKHRKSRIFITLETDLNAAANRMLFVRMNRARTADRFRYLGEVQGPDSPGATALQTSPKFVLLAASSGISCLGCGVSPLSHRELICSFRLGRHVFGNRARTKVPGHATSSFGFDRDARDLVLQD